MTPNLQAVEDQLTALAGGDPEKAELYLEALAERDRQQRYVCYWEPHTEQQKFFNQLTPEQDTWLVLGGNSSGKTDFAEWLVAVWLLGKEYFRGARNWRWVEKLPLPDLPVSVRGVGLTSDELRDPMLEKLMGSTEHPPFIPPSMVEHFNRQDVTILLKNKSKFHGKSADTDPKTHGGPSLDLVHIDEEVKYEILKENQRRIRKHGAKLLISATPLDDVSSVSVPWIFDLIEQWKAGDKTLGVVFMELEKNPYLDPEFIRREVTRLSGLPDAQARLYGIPVRRSGLYYKQWKSAPPLWVPAHDLDGGFRAVMIDPAVTGYVGALWAHFDARGNMTLYRAYKSKGQTVSQHVSNILVENRGDPINLWLADPFMGKQRVPDSTLTDQHKTVLQVWRDAGLSRLMLPDINYETCLTKSFEYIRAASDPTDPHPHLAVFDHLHDWEDEVSRYVIDSVVQGPKKGDILDRPRKGRDGSSTLMECFQYLAGMNLRARPDQRAPRPTVGSRNHFGTGAAPHPSKFAPKGFDPTPW